MVGLIANDHYQSIGIICLSVIRGGGIQRVARKRSISFKAPFTLEINFEIYVNLFLSKEKFLV